MEQLLDYKAFDPSVLEDYEPVELLDDGTAGYATNTVSGFYKAYYPAAAANERKHGVPWEVTLAQAALESGWGKSSLSEPPNYNFFGIKADSSWKGATVTKRTREETKAGQSYMINAPFRKYPSARASFDDHGEFLRKFSRYSAAFKTKDPYEFANRVAAAGYATAGNYASVLHGLINKFQAVHEVERGNFLKAAGHVILSREFAYVVMIAAVLGIGGFLAYRRYFRA